MVRPDGVGEVVEPNVSVVYDRVVHVDRRTATVRALEFGVPADVHEPPTVAAERKARGGHLDERGAFLPVHDPGDLDALLDRVGQALPVGADVEAVGHQIRSARSTEHQLLTGLPRADRLEGDPNATSAA